MYLYCVTLPVQSTLLQCLLGELELLEGTAETKGSISYASQDPWVFTGNVRENILFGLPYQMERYNRVLKACALDKVSIIILYMAANCHAWLQKYGIII